MAVQGVRPAWEPQESQVVKSPKLRLAKEPFSPSKVVSGLEALGQVTWGSEDIRKP